MPRKIQNTTKADLISVPLPAHGASYTVISHQFVIDYAYQALASAGFLIVDEEYRCTADGQIAQGIYRLNFNNDPELSMMFAWTNSYNKQVKFKCVIGAHINQTGSVMISGEIGSWIRKHTGSADTEVKDAIDDKIANAHMYYNQLCSDKAAMEAVSLNRRKQSQLLGVLFGEYEILTTEQASSVRDQMKKPQHVFASSDSLWAFYNYVTNALQLSHPRTWLEDQRILHYFIGTICDFTAPVQSVTAQITQVSDNQVVQEEVETDTVLHQSEEIILDATEADIDVTEEEVPWINDEVVTYTDPAGNTFEAPVIPDPDDDDDIPQVPGPEPENDAFEYSTNEANLDLISEEKVETTTPADFDLDFVTEETEDKDDLPDFF